MPVKHLVLATVLAACAAKQPAAPPPKPRVDTAALAAELDAHQAELALVLTRDRADCTALATNLRALFARMEVTLDRAREAQKDAEVAKALTSDLKRYDAAAAERTARMEAELTPDAPCIRDPRVRDALMTMPTL